MLRREFTSLLDDWLKPATFTDSAENGLQVEGRDEIEKVVCGVTANRALILAAIENDADAIVVHHGLVWGGGLRRLEGWIGERVRLLMKSDVNLFAYHLPLDAQPDFGNNAGLARALELVDVAPFGRYKGQLIGLSGRLPTPLKPHELYDVVARRIGKPIQFVGTDVVETIGVCSGGAADILHDAVAAGLDAYLTGEPAEWSQAVAQETGVAFIAAGHHATERFGPRALAEKLQRHGVEAMFVDVENPA
jgi:dinuclear metal center YbgI/SA1388 family protein